METSKVTWMTLVTLFKVYYKTSGMKLLLLFYSNRAPIKLLCKRSNWSYLSFRYLPHYTVPENMSRLSQPVFTCSKSTVETPE